MDMFQFQWCSNGKQCQPGFELRPSEAHRQVPKDVVRDGGRHLHWNFFYVKPMIHIMKGVFKGIEYQSYRQLCWFQSAWCSHSSRLECYCTRLMPNHIGSCFFRSRSRRRSGCQICENMSNGEGDGRSDSVIYPQLYLSLSSIVNLKFLNLLHPLVSPKKRRIYHTLRSVETFAPNAPPSQPPFLGLFRQWAMAGSICWKIGCWKATWIAEGRRIYKISIYIYICWMLKRKHDSLVML